MAELWTMKPPPRNVPKHGGAVPETQTTCGAVGQSLRPFIAGCVYGSFGPARIVRVMGKRESERAEGDPGPWLVCCEWVQTRAALTQPTLKFMCTLAG